MSFKNWRPARLVVPLAGSLILLFSHRFEGSARQMSAASADSSSDGARFLSRTTELCMLVAPRIGRWEVSTENNASHNGVGRPLRLTCVECMSPSTGVRIQAIWDRETGRLMQLFHFADPPTAPGA